MTSRSETTLRLKPVRVFRILVVRIVGRTTGITNISIRGVAAVGRQVAGVEASGKQHLNATYPYSPRAERRDKPSLRTVSADQFVLRHQLLDLCPRFAF